MAAVLRSIAVAPTDFPADVAQVEHLATVWSMILFIVPDGMFRSEEKRPDGVTLVPWALGRCLAWDATVVDTLAASHLPGTSVIAGSAAEAASAAKTRKYEGLTSTHIFVPLAFETLGPVCSEGASLIASMGNRLTSKSGDPRETQFLFQRLSIAIQRGNAASVRATLGSIPDYT